MVLAGMLLVSCNNDDDPTGVELYSFGPSPVLRGNDITFIGQNMNMVTSITLPDNIEITDIEKISNTQISITVPQDAEAGYVVLNYKGGAITTKTMLGFTEPYEITSISPVDVAVRAGDEVTIAGDYLNNIVLVEFSGGATVDSALFVSQSRTEIVLEVPNAASSGNIIVQDEAGNQLYSDQELTITQPSFSSFGSTSVKAGENLTINGANLDLVASVAFQGGTSVIAEDFVSVDEASIIVPAPDDIQDGTITLIAYSGAEIVSSESLTTVTPSDLDVSAVSKFKAGLAIEITGNDLDLVTSVTFTNSSDITDFSYSDKITVTIPNDAQDGSITLYLASGKTVETDAITLVKPDITSLSKTSMVSGNDLTINGTDLDLVAAITVGGENVEMSNQSATSVTVFVPYTISGNAAIVFTNINDTESNEASVNVTETSLPYVTNLPSSIERGTVLTLEGNNFDDLSNVTIGGNEMDYGINPNGRTMFLVTNAALGTQELTLTNSSGSISYTVVIYSGQLDPVADEDLVFFDFDSKNSWWGNVVVENNSDYSLDGSNYGRINYTAGGWAAFFARNGKNNFPADEIGTNISSYVMKFDILYIEPVTAGNFAWRFQDGDGNDYYYNYAPWSESGSYQPDGWTTETIALSEFGVTDMSTISNEFSLNYNSDESSEINIAIDNVRFEKID